MSVPPQPFLTEVPLEKLKEARYRANRYERLSDAKQEMFGFDIVWCSGCGDVINRDTDSWDEWEFCRAKECSRHFCDACTPVYFRGRRPFGQHEFGYWKAKGEEHPGAVFENGRPQKNCAFCVQQKQLHKRDRSPERKIEDVEPKAN